jgi:hypothetical protein
MLTVKFKEMMGCLMECVLHHLNDRTQNTFKPSLVGQDKMMSLSTLDIIFSLNDEYYVVIVVSIFFRIFSHLPVIVTNNRFQVARGGWLPDQNITFFFTPYQLQILLC